MATKSSFLKAYNTHFFEFLDDVIRILPEDPDIQKARNSFETIKKMNPTSLCKAWMKFVYVPYKDVIDTESFDISGAFLQGLEYSELAEMSRSLGYEYRVPRKVYIKPPANVWRHFKRITKCQVVLEFEFESDV